MSGEVTLRTGVSVPEPVAKVMPRILSNLMNDDPIGFYELVAICRDRSHTLWPSADANLRERSLIESNGQPHDLTRDMVLACVEGDLLEMRLVSPFSE